MSTRWVGLKIESPFAKNVEAEAVRETADGIGALFVCPKTGKEFVVGYDAHAAEMKRLALEAAISEKTGTGA